jgi:two-component system, cell cycle sensor histidine kinase and response regulator CckA
MHPTNWIERNTIRVASLTPGQHVVSVQVHDFDGRRSTVATRTFTVLLPWWRRPSFLLLALLGTGAVAIAWERARLAATRERAQILEENEQRLAESELRFRRLFEGGTAPQLLLTDGRVRQANAALGTLQGVDPDTLIGVEGESLFPGLASHLQAATVSAVWEGTLIHADARRIPVELHRTRIVLPDLVIEHLEVRDLREQQRLEREREALEMQLRDTQRLESVGTLAGGVAHDFNNLLTVIHTNAEMVASDVSSESDSGQALQQLLLASTRAREVVRQILTFSRRATPRQVPVLVRTLLQETESLLRATVPTTVQLRIDNTATDAVVHGDETQLQQVLLNLGSNAEHAMRATLGGTLRISAEWIDDAERPLQLSVQDNGVGIPDDVRSRMFEPFFTTKAVGEGTGLGLSVLYGIVQGHGGTVHVHSHVGEGTRVDIRLPASRATVASSAVAIPVHLSAGEPVQLLVVDDEEAVRTSVARVLTRRGFMVDTATNGAEALARVGAQHGFALIITDQTMPVMTGWEFVSRLRSAGNDVPVIIASGYGLSTEQSTLEQMPKLWRIDKPFSSDELVGLVHAILEERA